MPVIARGARVSESLRESEGVEARTARMLRRDSTVDRRGTRLRRASAGEGNCSAAASRGNGTAGIAGEASRLQSLCALLAWCLLSELCMMMMGEEMVMCVRVAGWIRLVPVPCLAGSSGAKRWRSDNLQDWQFEGRSVKSDKNQD